MKKKMINIGTWRKIKDKEKMKGYQINKKSQIAHGKFNKELNVE